MAKGMYIGVDSKARKVKKVYIGVDGKARKVKKAYIGVGGVARPFYSRSGVEHYGTVSALSTAKQYIATASIGDYALFAGGGTAGAMNNAEVDAYSSKLVKSKATAMNTGRATYGTTVGEYALFGGGADNSSEYKTVDAYNSSLIHSSPDTLTNSREQVGAASAKNAYAIFACGRYKSGSSYSSLNTVDFYDTQLVHSKKTYLSNATNLLGASVGDYALFVGTSTTSAAYNASLVRSTLAAPSIQNNGVAVFVSAGKYAMYHTGVINTGYCAEVYDEALIKTSITPLSTERSQHGGAYCNGYTIIAGGYREATVDIYDANLVHSVGTSLSAARSYAAGGAVGDYALFAGGFTSNWVDTVDAYEANS